ncbi:putative 30S ribosomal protein S15, partial [Toxoplasma gondii CAST]
MASLARRIFSPTKALGAAAKRNPLLRFDGRSSARSRASPPLPLSSSLSEASSSPRSSSRSSSRSSPLFALSTSYPSLLAASSPSSSSPLSSLSPSCPSPLPSPSPLSPPSTLSSPSLGGRPAAWCLDQRRGVARLKSHRYGGVVALKTRAPKSPWYIEAEKEFLNERAQVPDAYIERWHGEDLSKLSPALRRCLHLRCASSKELHSWRKLQLCRLLQRRPFDTGSPAVQLACLTEKILNVRAHLLRHFRDQQKKKVLSIWLSRRHRVMKYLYRVDFNLYKYVCQQLRIKCVRFAIPDSRDRQRAISPIAVDGDRCKFLIRQKLWK